MIFLTIGTAEPFDRLVKAMDNIALSVPEEILAQISHSAYEPRNMKTVGFISPTEYYKLFNSASLIVSHAGMGTIISALQNGKKLIIMPRKLSLGEHHTDHQIATANKLAALNYVKVANDEKELLQMIKEMLIEKPVVSSIGDYASHQLIKSLQDYIETS